VVQLAQHRTALILYAVLLVLPAVVFGGLLWHQLSSDHRQQLAIAPAGAQDAGNRLVIGVHDHLEALFAQEHERPYFHFQEDHYERGTNDSGSFLRSPLSDAVRPEGVLTWFAFESAHGADALPDHFWGANAFREGDMERKQALVDLVLAEVVAPLRDISKREIREELALDAELTSRRVLGEDAHPAGGLLEMRPYSLASVAYNLHQGRDPDCMGRDVAALVNLLGERRIPTYVTPYRYRLVRDAEGARRIIGTRRFMIMRFVDSDVLEEELPDAFYSLAAQKTDVVQGVVIDGEWVFEELPREIARRVLSGRQELLIGDERARALEDGWESATVDILVGCDIELEHPADREGREVSVATDVGALAGAFRVQTYWFAGVAAVMVISLALGLRLLIGSVRASQEQARRTENFVASVTHELRTPITAVKMYGEMLRDGWVKKERQDEYLARIVSESNRLNGLVDRVLEKRRLLGAPQAPEPGDLSREVARLRDEQGLRDAPDVVFELADDLPQVLLIQLGVHALVANLVENARKYAPVDSRDPDAEPIVVRTALAGRHVVLEVLDRGPGVPVQERKKVFDEFYRVGDEATRRAPGTGLGLHLVAQYARAMRGSAEVLPRPGGGSCFQVTFKTLKGPLRS
jgi:signal transduction histidine kinase